jgi:hypothetical protein
MFFLEFFKKTEGLSYGYPNMMFSLIDTPHSNLPFPASIELGQILVPLIMKNFNVNYYSDILRQGLNNRLFNTTLLNLTIWECYVAMYTQNKTILGNNFDFFNLLITWVGQLKFIFRLCGYSRIR